MQREFALLLLVLAVVAAGCTAQDVIVNTEGPDVKGGVQEVTTTEAGAQAGAAGMDKFVGKWRSYTDPNNFRYLELSAGTWTLGSSSGTWTTQPITEEDWEKWGLAPYGPKRKIVLYSWNKGIAVGPIEESAERVDFFWVIYNATLPSGENEYRVKYGH